MGQCFALLNIFLSIKGERATTIAFAIVGRPITIALQKEKKAWINVQNRSNKGSKELVKKNDRFCKDWKAITIWVGSNKEKSNISVAILEQNCQLHLIFISQFKNN